MLREIAIDVMRGHDLQTFKVYLSVNFYFAKFARFLEILHSHLCNARVTVPPLGSIIITQLVTHYV